jgi:tetratricopeptide (TPR) repeat protein
MDQAMDNLAPAPAQAYDLAMSAYNAGNMPEVERLCLEIIAARADFFEAIHLLGIAQSRSGKKEAALASFERALEVRPDPVVLTSRGATLHGLRRFAEALASYDRALALRPDYPEAHANRGAALQELRRFAEALASYDRALALRPQDAAALYNRANTLQELKRFDEALAGYDGVLALRPDHAAALYNRGNAFHALKRFDEALASYDRALTLRPNYPEALCNRAVTLQEVGRLEEALASYDRALALRPNYAMALYNRGGALRELSRLEAALASYDHALAVQPNYAEALFNRGNTLHDLRRFEEALASYDDALALRPGDAAILANRGASLHELQRFEEALASYDRTLVVRPHNVEVLYNRGNTLHDLQRFDEALASYEAAVMHRPDYVEALTNRGVVLHVLKRFAEALASYERALTLRPQFAEAHFSEALCRLLIGDFEHGWKKYEWRWETRQLAQDKRQFVQPLWLGSNDIAGKTILLHGEQGYGDAIQFCRYVPLVAMRGARVILEVPAPLRELMSSLSGVAQVVERGASLPDFDLQCPLLSLPLAFATRLDTIPAATPYLSASPQAKMDWDNELGSRQRLRVGLAWSGSPTNKNDKHRSIPLRTLLPLLDADVTFVSLQKDVRPTDAAVLRECSTRLRDIRNELRAFSDTAAVISNLDLVITADTSVAHLAGALAKPVWVLLPFVNDWRWLLDRNDSPWYPSARLFRQDVTRVWEPVIAQVHAALLDLVRGRS